MSQTKRKTAVKNTIDVDVGVSMEEASLPSSDADTRVTSGKRKQYDIDWGLFALIEFIGAQREEIAKSYRTALDIGSGAGVQTAILRHAGLEVFQVDKYSPTAEFQVDFLKHEFHQKFDIIYCSHVIEHQRNVGGFLDKIYDILADDGLLIISAPKHEPERLIEGHLNCFYTAYFIQHLVHSGFDCSKGKFLSCGQIENAAIVPKATNFCLSERDEVGYMWTSKHQQRCFFELKNNIELNNVVWYFHNCSIFSASNEQKLYMNVPTNQPSLGIDIISSRHGLKAEL